MLHGFANDFFDDWWKNLAMATEISVNFVWVDSNNEWQIPEDWEPHLFDLSVSENLNEVAEYWNEKHDLARICTELVPPPEFLANPQFDTTYFDFIFYC